MQTFDAIMTRRSVRSFRPDPIDPARIETLLTAAMNAPSAGDGRPWHFVVTDERAKLDALADQVDAGNPMFRQAGAAILICLDPSLEKFKGFGPQDCSCAAQNLQLAAHDLGLGTVWIAVIGIPPREQGCRTIFGVPPEIQPFALFPIGVPADLPPPERRYDAGRVHRGQWGCHGE